MEAGAIGMNGVNAHVLVAVVFQYNIVIVIIQHRRMEVCFVLAKDCDIKFVIRMYVQKGIQVIASSSVQNITMKCIKESNTNGWHILTVVSDIRLKEVTFFSAKLFHR